MEKSKKPDTLKKINFIERNKLMASKKKTTNVQENKTTDEAKKDTKQRPHTAAGKSVTRKQTTDNLSTRKHKSVPPQERREKENLRPSCAPKTIKPKSAPPAMAKRRLVRKSSVDLDIISKMIARNLHEPLLSIFITFDSRTLTACRFTCSTWYRYMKVVFWREVRARRELEWRLQWRWSEKIFHKVELKVSGLGCKKKCAENFRACTCKDQLDCSLSGNSLVVDFGGTNFQGEYVTNNKTVDIVRNEFETEQFQLTFHLKLDLKLETSNWLCTPVFIKKKPNRTKIEFDSLSVLKHPGDPTYLIIKDKNTQEIKHKFQPTLRKPIDNLDYSCGRLAVLTGGRVFVYSAEKLAKGNHGGALLLSQYKEMKPADPPVHFMFLSENVLLTVNGCSITMYDFWRFDLTSNTKDFLT